MKEAQLPLTVRLKESAAQFRNVGLAEHANFGNDAFGSEALGVVDLTPPIQDGVTWKTTMTE